MLTAFCVFADSLGALYGPLILDMSRVSVHRKDVNAFKGTINLKPSCPEIRIHDEVRIWRL